MAYVAYAICCYKYYILTIYVSFMCLSNTVPCLFSKVFISPLFHMFKDGNEAFPQVSKIIFHMGRDFFVIVTGNESVCFQFPKLLCQA